MQLPVNVWGFLRAGSLHPKSPVHGVAWFARVNVGISGGRGQEKEEPPSWLRGEVLLRSDWPVGGSGG